MKTIYLLRHAKSSWKNPGLADLDRPLSTRGISNARAIGRHLAEHFRLPALVLCSPAERTRRTLDLIAEAWPAAVPTRYERQLYLADAPTLLRRLRRLSDALASVMVVGHNPGLETLARSLIEGGDAEALSALRAKFPTGALAVIDAAVAHWSELKTGAGTLTAFVLPRTLADG